jgi:NAD(P)H-dependent FMN reductase|tara:strand:+ start:1559 stop:2173 length:615 start_codon:yes stop_codon:yes gene_type:complete
MNITIVSGSHRQNSQSIKIAKAIKSAFKPLKECDEANIFDLADNPLPLWHEDMKKVGKPSKSLIESISKKLACSDAFIIISPEWHGMVPAGLKNFFLMWSNGELAHKPALIVTVSSGDGGSYPVAELRMSSYKNNRICFLPEHLIIRNVESVFNDNEIDNNSSSQAYFENRLDYCLKQLLTYGKAFNQIRESDTVSIKKYGSGM